MAEKMYGVDFFAGFLVGALVGAATALLLAPQSGEDTRGYIRDRGIELKERADKLSDDARHRAEELQGQAKERAQTLSTQAKERAGDLQLRVKEAVEEGKTAAARRKEELLSQLNQEAGSDEEPAEV
jgi:gas vesicle protein